MQSMHWFTIAAPAPVWNEVRRWDSTTYSFFDAYGNWQRG
jgi:hypothetical protein